MKRTNMNTSIFTSTGSQLRRALALIVLALLPTAQAVSPAPHGDYGNFNTAEGGNALLKLNVNLGNNNSALGANALASVVSGSANTAVGSGALAANTNSNNPAVGFRACSEIP